VRVIPQSIRGRLLLGALVFTGAALLLASVSIGEVLDRFVRRGLDERLDTQIALLAHAVGPDGRVNRPLLQEIGPFTLHHRGWAWRIEGTDGSVSSNMIQRYERELEEARQARRAERARRRAEEAERRGDIQERDRIRDEARERERALEEWRRRPRSDSTEGLYVRRWRKPSTAGPVTITVVAPREAVDRMRWAIATPLLLSVAALGGFLLVSTLLQLSVGLRPLARLRGSLAAVRGGAATRVPEDQPAELREVVGELNALLDENEAALTRARGHVSNLAHGLKTPLATLAVRLAEPGRDPDGELATLVGQIDQSIRHHLGRARAASPGAPGQPQVPLRAAIEGLAGALARIHADRGVTPELDIPADLSVKCDPQDLDEMLGNLLDNAWRWTSGRIAVSAAQDGGVIRIAIDDDGPGLTDEAATRALVPGQRLDERGDGHGFGLPIARELAELHGGGLELSRSPLGGLRATLALPG